MLCGAYLLDRSILHPLLGELPDVIHLPARIGTESMLRNAIDLLGTELGAQRRAGSEAAIPALIDLLLIYILRSWFESGSVQHGWGDALRDPSTAVALGVIHHDLAIPGRSRNSRP